MGLGCFLLLSSCNYLDVVPDNIATIDHAFKNRIEAQRYLYGCFSFMPRVGDLTKNPALLGGDEVWIIEPITWVSGTEIFWHIALGEQSASSPLANYWSSRQSSVALNGGNALFTALSDINIFLENVHKPYDLQEEERNKWTGEALFLKAYYHFWLFRMYGPIPLIRENIPLDAIGDEIQRYREPVDEVADYIAGLCDAAAALLPLNVENMMEEMGMPTKPVALALKAQALTYAASPLFNCNGDYADYMDKRGVQLFPQDKSKEKDKWKKAADALKVAIKTAHEAGHRLFDFHRSNFATLLHEKTILAMQSRGAVTERWNDEIIWGSSQSAGNTPLQRLCFPYFTQVQGDGGSGQKCYAPPLRMVEQFYTKNGLPIADDKDWIGVDPWGLRVAGEEDRWYIRENFQTINLHFDREARFYGAIFFDGGTFYGNNRLANDNTTNHNYMWVTELKARDMSGVITPGRYSSTGYICKKLTSYMSTFSDNATGLGGLYAYSFPIIRLADLYLMYAEALNEYEGTTAEAYSYVDMVRERSGLKGVVESWRDHAVSGKENYPTTQEGLREIIRRERLNELAFEGIRFWDLRRWKLAEEYMNQPIRGLNIYGNTAEEYYQETEKYPLTFGKKDYFWPVRVSTLLNNSNILQSPGW
jgi:hypothetical protein